MRPKAFWRANKGSAAVEFALVAMPFFALIGGVIELGLIFMAQVLLDNAMMTASREIRTGNNQSATTPAVQAVQLTNFQRDVCHEMQWMVADCETNLQLTVDTYTAFSAVPLTSPVSGGTFSLVQNFNTGGPGSIVVVRAYYQWTLFIPVLNQALERTPGKTMLTSIAAFANEPFTANPPATVAVTPP